MRTSGEALALDLSVVVPCYNEELNVPELAQRTLGVFDRARLSGELILVDDGSQDATARVIADLSSRHAGVVGRFHRKNRGIVGAWRTGIAAARGEAVALIDADLQYQPEDLLRLHRALREHCVDIVQGWRSSTARESDVRYAMSRGFNHLLNRAFAMNLHDNKSGFVCAAKEVLEDVLTFGRGYHYAQSFIMVAAHAKGYSYREIEALFEPRKQGHSFLQHSLVRATTRSFVDVGRALWDFRIRRPGTDPGRRLVHDRDIDVPDAPSPRAHPSRWRAYMRTFDQTHWMIRREGVERYYETLNATQWLPADQLRAYQDEKLRRLVRHAYRNVPYYRAKMQAAALRPEDIRGQQDLHKLPLLTKDDVRRHLYFDIRAENVEHADMLRVTTSGSTGEPFVCYADRSQLEFRWAATLRSQEWTGYRFGDPTVRLWHQTLGMSKLQVVRERADAALSNRTFVPVFKMSDATLERLLEVIARKRPVLVDGYAEALDFLARYVDARGGNGPKPKAVMSSAQTLPRKSRDTIERAFGCSVFDKYGSREFSGIAYECAAHEGHHVVSEGYIVEVLVNGRPAQPGEVGEVVVTDLNNFCMPFIRYRIGDLAHGVIDAPCGCGRALPRIGDIQGRVQSIIQGTDGRYVPGTFFAHLLRDYDYAIRRFQVVQTEPGAIRFRVVKGARYSDEVVDQVSGECRKYLGADLRIQIEHVDEIPMIRTGKHVASVSVLPVDFQRNAPVAAAGF